MTRALFGTDIPDPTAPGIYTTEDADGAATYFVRHPRPPLWRRLWVRLFGPHDPRGASGVVVIDIDLPEEP